MTNCVTWTCMMENCEVITMQQVQSTPTVTHTDLGKDTKKRRTWWCFMAPMSPARATKKRKTPTPMIPPTTWKLDTRPNHFPHAAMPIIRRLTI